MLLVVGQFIGSVKLGALDGCLVRWLLHLFVGSLLGWSYAALVDWLVGWLVVICSPVVHQPVTQQIAWLAVGWLVVACQWLLGRVVSCLLGQCCLS